MFIIIKVLCHYIEQSLVISFGLFIGLGNRFYANKGSNQCILIDGSDGSIKIFEYHQYVDDTNKKNHTSKLVIMKKKKKNT